MPYVYIVRCANGALYTGWTTDLDRRIAQHNAGRGGAYTRRHRPVTLVYREEVADRGAALRREAAIKRYDRLHKEQLIGATLADEISLAASGRPLQPAEGGCVPREEHALVHDAPRQDRPGGDA